MDEIEELAQMVRADIEFAERFLLGQDSDWSVRFTQESELTTAIHIGVKGS